MFTKEGKGVDKNEPQKRAFFRFWEQVWQKRFKLMGLNLMYFISNLIPMVLAALSYFMAVSLYFTLSSEQSLVDYLTNDPNSANHWSMFLLGLFFVVGICTVIPVFSAGPFQAGFMYIIRSFVRREPVFLWNDYISKAKSNLKLSLKVCLINALAGFVIMIDLAVYLAISHNKLGIFGGVPNWLLFIVALIVVFTTFLFLTMNMFLYPMVVTFRITIKQLYKNAMIFAVLRWLPNLGIVLLDAALVALPLLVDPTVSNYFALLIYAIIGLAFIGFLNTF